MRSAVKGAGKWTSNWRVKCGPKVEERVCALLVVLQERKRAMGAAWGNGTCAETVLEEARGNVMLVHKWRLVESHTAFHLCNREGRAPEDHHR